MVNYPALHKHDLVLFDDIRTVVVFGVLDLVFCINSMFCSVLDSALSLVQCS